MISLPLNVCNDNCLNSGNTSGNTSVNSFDPIIVNDCGILICDNAPENIQLKEIETPLCACDTPIVEEKTITTKRIKTIKNCLGEFLQNTTKQKFCEIGPKCMV